MRVPGAKARRDSSLDSYQHSMRQVIGLIEAILSQRIGCRQVFAWRASRRRSSRETHARTFEQVSDGTLVGTRNLLISDCAIRLRIVRACVGLITRRVDTSSHTQSSFYGEDGLIERATMNPWLVLGSQVSNMGPASCELELHVAPPSAEVENPTSR